MCHFSRKPHAKLCCGGEDLIYESIRSPKNSTLGPNSVQHVTSRRRSFASELSSRFSRSKRGSVSETRGDRQRKSSLLSVMHEGSNSRRSSSLPAGPKPVPEEQEDEEEEVDDKNDHTQEDQEEEEQDDDDDDEEDDDDEDEDDDEEGQGEREQGDNEQDEGQHNHSHRKRHRHQRRRRRLHKQHSHGQVELEEQENHHRHCQHCGHCEHCGHRQDDDDNDQDEEDEVDDDDHPDGDPVHQVLNCDHIHCLTHLKTRSASELSTSLPASTTSPVEVYIARGALTDEESDGEQQFDFALTRHHHHHRHHHHSHNSSSPLPPQRTLSDQSLDSRGRVSDGLRSLVSCLVPGISYQRRRHKRQRGAPLTQQPSVTSNEHFQAHSTCTGSTSRSTSRNQRRGLSTSPETTEGRRSAATAAESPPPPTALSHCKSIPPPPPPPHSSLHQGHSSHHSHPFHRTPTPPPPPVPPHTPPPPPPPLLQRVCVHSHSQHLHSQQQSHQSHHQHHCIPHTSSSKCHQTCKASPLLEQLPQCISSQDSSSTFTDSRSNSRLGNHQTNGTSNNNHTSHNIDIQSNRGTNDQRDRRKDESKKRKKQKKKLSTTKQPAGQEEADGQEGQGEEENERKEDTDGDRDGDEDGDGERREEDEQIHRDIRRPQMRGPVNEGEKEKEESAAATVKKAGVKEEEKVNKLLDGPSCDCRTLATEGNEFALLHETGGLRNRGEIKLTTSAGTTTTAAAASTGNCVIVGDSLTTSSNAFDRMSVIACNNCLTSRKGDCNCTSSSNITCSSSSARHQLVHYTMDSTTHSMCPVLSIAHGTNPMAILHVEVEVATPPPPPVPPIRTSGKSLLPATSYNSSSTTPSPSATNVNRIKRTAPIHPPSNASFNCTPNKSSSTGECTTAPTITTSSTLTTSTTITTSTTTTLATISFSSPSCINTNHLVSNVVASVTPVNASPVRQQESPLLLTTISEQMRRKKKSKAPNPPGRHSPHQLQSSIESPSVTPVPPPSVTSVASSTTATAAAAATATATATATSNATKVPVESNVTGSIDHWPIEVINSNDLTLNEQAGDEQLRDEQLTPGATVGQIVVTSTTSTLETTAISASICASSSPATTASGVDSTCTSSSSAYSSSCRKRKSLKNRPAPFPPALSDVSLIRSLSEQKQLNVKNMLIAAPSFRSVPQFNLTTFAINHQTGHGQEEEEESLVISLNDDSDFQDESHLVNHNQKHGHCSSNYYTDDSCPLLPDLTTDQVPDQSGSVSPTPPSHHLSSSQFVHPSLARFSLSPCTSSSSRCVLPFASISDTKDFSSSKDVSVQVPSFPSPPSDHPDNLHQQYQPLEQVQVKQHRHCPRQEDHLDHFFHLDHSSRREETGPPKKKAGEKKNIYKHPRTFCVSVTNDVDSFTQFQVQLDEQAGNECNLPTDGPKFIPKNNQVTSEPAPILYSKCQLDTCNGSLNAAPLGQREDSSSSQLLLHHHHQQHHLHEHCHDEQNALHEKGDEDEDGQQSVAGKSFRIKSEPQQMPQLPKNQINYPSYTERASTTCPTSSVTSGLSSSSFCSLTDATAVAGGKITGVTFACKTCGCHLFRGEAYKHPLTYSLTSNNINNNNNNNNNNFKCRNNNNKNNNMSNSDNNISECKDKSDTNNNNNTINSNNVNEKKEKDASRVNVCPGDCSSARVNESSDTSSTPPPPPHPCHGHNNDCSISPPLTPASKSDSKSQEEQLNQLPLKCDHEASQLVNHKELKVKKLNENRTVLAVNVTKVMSRDLPYCHTGNCSKCPANSTGCYRCCPSSNATTAAAAAVAVAAVAAAVSSGRTFGESSSSSSSLGLTFNSMTLGCRRGRSNSYPLNTWYIDRKDTLYTLSTVKCTTQGTTRAPSVPNVDVNSCIHQNIDFSAISQTLKALLSPIRRPSQELKS